MTPLTALMGNARGAFRNLLEIGQFAERGVAIIMLSETKTAQLRLPGFEVYTTNHSDGISTKISTKIKHVRIEPPAVSWSYSSDRVR